MMYAKEAKKSSQMSITDSKKAMSSLSFRESGPSLQHISKRISNSKLMLGKTEISFYEKKNANKFDKTKQFCFVGNQFETKEAIASN